MNNERNEWIELPKRIRAQNKFDCEIISLNAYSN